MGGGSSSAPAPFVGGYGGSWIAWSQAKTLTVHEPTARAAGVSLGAGMLAPLAGDGCGLAVTARIADYLAGSSARQCGPCMFGLPAIASIVAQLAVGRAARGDLRRLDRFSAQVAGRGAVAIQMARCGWCCPPSPSSPTT